MDLLDEFEAATIAEGFPPDPDYHPDDPIHANPTCRVSNGLVPILNDTCGIWKPDGDRYRALAIKTREEIEREHKQEELQRLEYESRRRREQKFIDDHNRVMAEEAKACSRHGEPVVTLLGRDWNLWLNLQLRNNPDHITVPDDAPQWVHLYLLQQNMKRLGEGL